MNITENMCIRIDDTRLRPFYIELAIVAREFFPIWSIDERIDKAQGEDRPFCMMFFYLQEFRTFSETLQRLIETDRHIDCVCIIEKLLVNRISPPEESLLQLCLLVKTHDDPTHEQSM